MTTKENLEKVRSAIGRRLPYQTMIDVDGGVVVVAVPLRDGKTGPVLKAALEAGLAITGGHATRRGFELEVE